MTMYDDGEPSDDDDDDDDDDRRSRIDQEMRARSRRAVSVRERARGSREGREKKAVTFFHRCHIQRADLPPVRSQPPRADH